ncbi:hypothetical protein [Corynebacterium variabile]|uniref:hypothetical protein n=2 Tax=Corynebacterium variabile TaxID=1727 RepID=UPI0028B1D065|nr:hypothetical protein [Corynebacterium variabile]
MLLLFSAGNSPSSGDGGEGLSHVEAKADRKVEGGDMGFTHTQAMTTVVVATFAILILTGCAGDSGESGDAATAGKGMLSRTTGHGIAENTVEVLPPDSLAPGMEMTELREYLESSGMSDRWVDEAVDAMVTGDYAAMESLSLQQYMGEPDGRTTPFADEVLESLRR